MGSLSGWGSCTPCLATPALRPPREQRLYSETDIFSAAGRRRCLLPTRLGTKP